MDGYVAMWLEGACRFKVGELVAAPHGEENVSIERARIMDIKDEKFEVRLWW